MQTEVLGLTPGPGKGLDIVFFFCYILFNDKDVIKINVMLNLFQHLTLFLI